MYILFKPMDSWATQNALYTSLMISLLTFHIFKLFDQSNFIYWAQLYVVKQTCTLCPAFRSSAFNVQFWCIELIVGGALHKSLGLAGRGSAIHEANALISVVCGFWIRDTIPWSTGGLIGKFNIRASPCFNHIHQRSMSGKHSLHFWIILLRNVLTAIMHDS